MSSLLNRDLSCATPLEAPRHVHQWVRLFTLYSLVAYSNRHEEPPINNRFKQQEWRRGAGCQKSPNRPICQGIQYLVKLLFSCLLINYCTHITIVERAFHRCAKSPSIVALFVFVSPV